MILALLLAAQPRPVETPDARYEHCLTRAAGDPVAAETEAGAWQIAGGGFLAHQCLGMAYATEHRWSAAAAEFEAAARGAEVARDMRGATYWAQAGNAWLAGGDAAKARADLDAALSGGTLLGPPRGEAELDRARALVADGDMPGARSDLDHALVDAARDPLAWLLSATLARRMRDLPRARKDIAQAILLSSDDASVQLEAGNIAAASGDAAGAKAAWNRAVGVQPASEAARHATDALKQFEGLAPAQ